MLSACAPAATKSSTQLVEANDNRRAAGVRRGDTLFVDLEVRRARWYPEAPDSAFIDAPMLAEVGHAPQVPGPLLRVVEGTTIVATLRNALADSAVWWFGVNARPGLDSLRIKPGETTTLRFVAGAPGTYFYSAREGVNDYSHGEREQLAGAFVIDARGARTDDRIFVLNIFSEPLDSLTGRNALAINGRGWPYTERLHATEGDTLRWRVVNTTIRPHPMHLHGFYFRLLSTGNGIADTTFADSARPMLVTQLMEPLTTMTLSWVAEREGNWLFHCHFPFHADAESRLTPGVTHADHASGDARRHMAGLVMGIDVSKGSARTPRDRTNARQMRLLVQEAKRRGVAKRALGYVLQQGDAPTRDSINLPGTLLVLTRDEPTDITVVNHLKEATAVHWHGIELESFSDGVAGWSGAPKKVAPAIAPADSFKAQLTVPRAGTFIYHTHLNDVEQLTSGLYGAMVVLEPTQRFNPETDHVFVVGWDGPDEPARLLVNGDSLPAPRVFKVGKHHRMRFVFIPVIGGDTFTLSSPSGVAQWRRMARDGAELPAAQQTLVPASVTGWAGQTFDFDFAPTKPGDYTLMTGDPKKPIWKGIIRVR